MADRSNEITVDAEINQCNVFENQTILLNDDGTLHLVGNGVSSRSAADKELRHAGETKKKGAESVGSERVASTLSVPQNPEFLRLFQEQMINNQKMFFEQQKAINSLSQSVAEMKSHVVEKRTTTDSSAHAHTDKYYDSVSEEESDYESDESEEAPSKRMKTSSVSKIDRLKKVESIFTKQKKLGPAVHTEIAKIVNSGAESSVDHKSKEVQELFDKYDRPENCEFLEVPKVNKVLWTSKDIGKTLKDGDRGLQRTQGYLVKGLIPLVMLMNKALNSTTEESEEMFELSLDALNLLLYAHRDLSSQRRKLLTPALDKKYVALGNDGEKMSANFLFGEQEDLEKRMKEIDDSLKLGKKMKGKDFSFSNRDSKKDSNDSFNNNDNFEDSNFRRKPSFKTNFLAKRAQHHQKDKKKGKKPKGGLGRQK